MSSTDQFSWGLFWEELLLDRGSDIVALHFGFLEGRPTLHPNLPSVVFPLLACYILVWCEKFCAASLTVIGQVRYWWARSDPLPLVVVGTGGLVPTLYRLPVVGTGEFVPTLCPVYLFIQGQYCRLYSGCSAEFRSSCSNSQL